MNQRLIVIDGKTYKSVDEMPPDIRAKYEEAMGGLDRDRNGMPDMLDTMNPFEDKNKDGIPDSFEGLATSQGSAPTVMSSSKILANGQVYDSLDQLPPEVRAKYEEAMGAMDKNRNGIPDFVEGMFNMPAQSMDTPAKDAPISPEISTPRPASRNSAISTSTIEPESSGGWMLALAGIALIGLCLVAVAAGVWYFFLR
ncbi:MAG TPA: hypothetical protein VFR47_16550 [Anaerolineales bacterium]|nr:hypothetical protein [Anaerolineales bacterium]